MKNKKLRVWGTYYTESDKGRRYVADYDEEITVDVEKADGTILEGGFLLAHVQKHIIEAHLIKKFGRDRVFGWQTCQVGEIEQTVPVTPNTAKKQKAGVSRETSPDNDLKIE